MSKILYPIFNLPNENNEENEGIPTWIKWWLLNNYNKKHSWVLSEIITGNPLLLANSVETPFYLPPLPRGNTTQIHYEGKNLFDKDNANIFGGFFSADTISYSSLAKTLYIECEPNTTYTVSKIQTARFAVGTTNTVPAVGDSIINYENNPTATEITINTSSTANYLLVFYYNPNYDTLTEQQILNTIQIEKGSTATSYEPYVGGTASPSPLFPQLINNVTGDVEVLDQNKNLFDKEDVINAYLNADGTTTSNNTFRVSNYINVKGSANITISGNYGGSEYCCFYDKNKDFISNFGMGSLTTRSASVPSNAEYIRVTVRQDVLNEYQLEKGSTATTYTPHKEQDFIFPLGTQRMYIGDYPGDDGIHHVRAQVTFDGSQDETWWIRSDTHEIRTGMLSSYNAVSGSDILCNQLLQVNSYTEGANGVRWVLNSQDICIHSNDLNTSTITIPEWREYLSENPLVIEFDISTEEVTPYTEAQQTAYDEIKQAFSYEEQTNISGSSDGANPIFEVQYYMKNESEGE